MLLKPGAVSVHRHPDYPVRLFTSDGRGGADTVAWPIAQGLIGSVGQPVIVGDRRAAAFRGRLI